MQSVYDSFEDLRKNPEKGLDKEKINLTEILNERKYSVKKLTIIKFCLKAYFFTMQSPGIGIIYILMNLGAVYFGFIISKRMSQFLVASLVLNNFDDSFSKSIDSGKMKSE